MFNNRSGELVGFVYNGAEMAKQVLSFMVIGINSNIKYSLGYFGTNSATADEIYPLFWECVSHLELTCGLKVT